MVALAGPLTNLALAMIAAIIWRVMMAYDGILDLVGFNALSNLATFIDVFVTINLYLMLFNLLPLGPLDGMKVLRGVAPHAWDGFLDQLERWGMVILLALIFLPTFALDLPADVCEREHPGDRPRPALQRALQPSAGGLGRDDAEDRVRRSDTLERRTRA